MKIKKIKLENSIVFKNDFEIEFGNLSLANKPTIHYLVGNNGNGKTTILETIYEYFNPNRVNGMSAISRIPLGDLTVEYSNSTISSFTESLNYEMTPKQDIRMCVVYSSNNPIRGIGAMPTTPFNPSLDDTNPYSKVSDLDNDIKSLISTICRESITPNVGYCEELERLVKQGDSIEHLKKFTDYAQPYINVLKSFDDTLSIDVASGNITIENIPLEFEKLSDGQKFMIYRIFQILKDVNNLNDSLILIDEPENNLHPEWQLKFKNVLLAALTGLNTQIIISTHSPYIFGEMNNEIEECFLINKNETAASKTQLGLTIKGVFKPPSMNLIAYKAFGIPTNELHIELYCELQKQLGVESVNGLEKKLKVSPYNLIPQYTGTDTKKQPDKICKKTDGIDGHPATVTRPTWIRNKLHHALCTERKEFVNSDLKISIDEMIGVLEKIRT
jgi:predicted ATPase